MSRRLHEVIGERYGLGSVLAEAEAGRSGIVPQRMPGQGGSDQFIVQVANNKVGLVIGKGGETIKSIQARTGARVQVIPLHLPPCDTPTERTVQINGSLAQVEAAKQLVMEVTSENRGRGSTMRWWLREPRQKPSRGV